MGRIIVITSGKGGVGKSTTTANLGCALALSGKSVVMIDGDTGLRNLDLLSGQSDRVVYDFSDVTGGKCKLSEALIDDKKIKGLYLLPASQTKEKDDIKEEEMKKLCMELSSKYDFVLVDSPAGIETGFKNAISAAEIAIVVVTPEFSSIRDADRILDRIEKAGIKKSGIVINRYRHDLSEKGILPRIDEIIELLAAKLLGVVPEDVKVLVAANKGNSVVTEKESKAGEAFRNIADRITGKTVPLMKFEEKKSRFSLFGKKQKTSEE